MFQRINPDELNGRQKEIYNFQKSAALLADYGFNCIKLSDDWQGADFLAHHFDGKITLKVQLKARLTVNRKYIGQDLWMNFPSTGSWYLVPHDKLVETIGQNTNWLNTTSWQENGTYSDANPSPRLLEQLLRYRLQTGPEPSPRPTEPPAPPVSAVPVTKANPARPTETRPSESGHWAHPNLNAAATVLRRAGYVCSSPPIGTRNVHLMARRNDSSSAISIRCPGRLEIRKARMNRDIHVVFPDQDGVWYLVPHDELVTVADRNTPWLSSPSWRVNGWYSSANPSRRLRAALRPFALNAT